MVVRRGATWLSVVALCALGLLLLELGGTFEEIPDELPRIDSAVDVAELTLLAQRDLEALRLGDLQGRMVVVFLADQGAVMSLEGSHLRNALARWSLPEDVVGVEVAGMMDIPTFMRASMEKMMGTIAAEWRFPMYLDYGGTFGEAFQIPKGHVGMVILDRSGEVVLRRAGESTAEEREQIRRLLGATEPPPPPRAPELVDLDPSLDPNSGELLLIFLDRAVRDIEVANSGMMAMAKALPDPSLRLLYQFAQAFVIPESVRLVIVGDYEGTAPWADAIIPDAVELRARLELPEAGAAIVAIDRELRLVGREHGTVALWKISLIADSIGATPKMPGQ